MGDGGDTSAIFMVDIAEFSSRDHATALKVRAALYTALADCARAAGIPWNDCACEDRGDGALIVVPPAIDCTPFFSEFPGRFAGWLERHNSAAPDSALSVRAAVHIGRVEHDGWGHVGAAANHTARLLDARPLRQALQGRPFALAASERVFEDLIQARAGGSDPDDFQRVEISVKETRGRAWLHVPGLRPPLPGVASSAGPDQLPAERGSFAGRSAEVAMLDSFLDDTGNRSPLVTVVGAPGVGKSALALHWAHSNSPHFPDGTLYADTGGYSASEPVPTLTVLARFLRALGVPGDQVPLDEDAASAEFRSLLRGKRILILLDDVVSADRVRPLLPAGGGCLVLATSRDRLTDLITHENADQLRLDVLSDADAVALLGAVLDEADQESAAALARACGNLPLALRVAAADITVRPGHNVRRAVAELRSHGPIDALDGEAAIRTAFDASYQQLSTVDQLIFRRLALCPGPEVGAGAATVLIGTTAGETRGALLRLTAAHLLIERSYGRYGYHDLLRAYATGLSRDEDAADAVHNGRAALLNWYIATVDAASLLLQPQVMRLQDGVRPGGTTFADVTEALNWMRTERASLVAAVVELAEPFPAEVADLADALRGFLAQERAFDALITVARTALKAAETIGDDRAAARALLALASAHRMLSRYETALDLAGRARVAAEAAGWIPGTASALGTAGNVLFETGRPERAAELLRHAAELAESVGARGAVLMHRGNLGVALECTGRCAEALAAYEIAAARSEQLGALGAEGMVRFGMSRCLRDLGRMTAALQAAEQAVKCNLRNGFEAGAIQALAYSAILLVETGATEQGLERLAEATERVRTLRDDETETMVLTSRGHVDLHRGRYDEAITALEHGRERGREANDYNLTVATIGLARARLGRGDHAAVAELVANAAERAEAGGYQILQAETVILQAQLACARGDLDIARDLEREAIARERELSCPQGLARALQITGIPGHLREAEQIQRAGGFQVPPV